jgi:hypothetical protein
MPKIVLDINSAKLMRPHAHGYAAKDLAVLHETVSPDVLGMSDINGVLNYLASKDYGIHGMTDLEGHKVWARGLGSAIFWQCGGVNERSVGIEQVSRVMLEAPTNALRRKLWVARSKQLRATAKLLACWHNADQKKHPLVYSDGRSPGVTSHWDVSQWSAASEGHTDCFPYHKGGYYPILEVIRMAKVYAATGLTF